MTNEEIVKEITNRHTYVADDIEYSDVIDACREMAEWKDEQTKNYLWSKLQNLERDARLDAAKAIKEVIKELFNEG